ncbi:MAG: hypothetical protein HY650_09385 [Acidobacteria bacterium]|nr:hypothetical protein [Acidobacteriota bacterium]
MNDPIRTALDAHLKSLPAGKVEALARRLGGVPAERLALFLDGLGLLAGHSPRAALEFLRVAPDLGRVLDLEELRLWVSAGKRLTSASPELGIQYFQVGGGTIGRLPAGLRRAVLGLVDRQAAISASAALDSLLTAPDRLASLSATEAATVCRIGMEVARRSAKQSAELFGMAPDVIRRLRELHSGDGEVAGGESADLVGQALGLTEMFALRAGGIAVDFFRELPGRLASGRHADRQLLLERTRDFLERGGGAALQFFETSACVLREAGLQSFQRWTELSLDIASRGNAAVYGFLKAAPGVVAQMRRVVPHDLDSVFSETLKVVHEVAEQNVYLGLECLRSSPQALGSASLVQFTSWARHGLREHSHDARHAHAYFALETNLSRYHLQSSAGGLALEALKPVLTHYIEGLCGQTLAIRSGAQVRLRELVDGFPVGNGKDLELPGLVCEFGEPDADFRLYKVWSALAAGQIEFGTFESGTQPLIALLERIEDDFSRDRNSPGGLPETAGIPTEARPGSPRTPLDSDARTRADFRLILSRFPDPRFARSVFAVLENGRLDRRLRAEYRGLGRDLDCLRAAWLQRRIAPERLPLELVIPELLFRLTVGGGVDDLTRAAFGDLTSALERIVDEHLPPRNLGVCGTLEAAYRIYRLAAEASSRGAAGEEETASSDLDEGAGRESPPAGEVPERLAAEAAARDSRRDSASLAASLREEWPDLSPRLEWSESLAVESTDETDLEPGDRAYLYDEWDRELADFRSGWCRIVERSARRGGRQFVELVRDQYASLIASVRQQFQLLRPEALKKIRGEIDGEDFDLQAVIDHALDRRTGRRTSDRLYIRRLRKERDVAVSFLLDMSSSTARTVMRAGASGPPRPAKRIIDIEKEGLVLMSEALEAVGDLYAVHGFTSEGRRNVRFYVVKDFQDRYGADVEARIGGITYQNNTRLGAAIRHSSRKLTEQDARTRLLIVLSDGRPYDHDYGDARYAREDTKVALREARMAGVTPFCITIDRESELQLRDLYGEVGYTIIDDVLSLPERLPGIYRRLTE